MRTRERPAEREAGEASRPLRSRLVWFVGLWLASVGALGTVAYGIRFWLGLG